MLPILPYLLLTALLIVLFSLYPELDLVLSRAVYAHYQGFLPKDEGIAGILYDLTQYFAWGCGIFLVGYGLLHLLRHRSIHKPSLFLLIVLALGPGLIVHTGFKDHWGRARPVHITEFGGNKKFTPALIPSNQCDDNCSFTSGHAAMAFYAMVFAFVIHNRRKRLLMLSTGIMMGLLIGWVRIIQGGHFLSDVLFSGLIVYGVAWCIAYLPPKRHALAPRIDPGM
jgi:lipid A 4'-phosphatase